MTRTAFLSVAALTALARAATGGDAPPPDRAGHGVPAARAAAATARVGQLAPSFVTRDAEGRRRSLATTAAGRPLVILFVQGGCPCSEAAQPFFNALHAAFADRVAVVGIFDGEPGEARAWAAERRVP